jgi:hypothetical protein
MEYNIDKGDYICTCKAQRAEYFPCHDGETDCTKCGYSQKKPVMIGHYNELTEVMNACCSCGCLSNILTIQATEEGMMCFYCYHKRYDQHE